MYYFLNCMGESYTEKLHRLHSYTVLKPQRDIFVGLLFGFRYWGALPTSLFLMWKNQATAESGGKFCQTSLLSCQDESEHSWAQQMLEAEPWAQGS